MGKLTNSPKPAAAGGAAAAAYNVAILCCSDLFDEREGVFEKKLLPFLFRQTRTIAHRRREHRVNSAVTQLRYEDIARPEPAERGREGHAETS